MKNNRVVFISHNGLLYSGNPKAIFLYLQQNFNGKFDTVFALKDPQTWNKWGGRFVKFPSARFLLDFCTAKVVVNNNLGIPLYLPKRESQYVIDTEHGGGAYKNNTNRGFVEIKEVTKSRHAMDLYKSHNTDLILSSCAVFSKLVISDIAPDYKGVVMPCGMPRNDFFFLNNRGQVRNGVCENLQTDPNKKIVLYAPTYRGSINKVKKQVFQIAMDVDRLMAAVSSRFNTEAVFMIRAHPVMKMNRSWPWKNTLDVSDYPDMQELLVAADVLISDYSSTIWDFSLTGKPCFLFVPDMETYISERGVYTPMETWPGILCRTNEELEQAVLRFDEGVYRARIEQYHKDMGSYENGRACEQVCNHIAQVCGVLKK